MKKTNGENRLLYKMIKYDIVRGRWGLGEKLTISELCSAYPEYNAVAVRGALFELLPTGLVESSSHSGFRVGKIDYKKYLAVLALHDIYELQSAVLATDYMNSSVVHALEKEYDNLELMYFVKDWKRFAERKETFLNIIHYAHPFFKLQDEVFAQREKLQIINILLPAEIDDDFVCVEALREVFAGCRENDPGRVEKGMLGYERERMLQILKFFEVLLSKKNGELSPFFGQFLYGSGDSKQAISEMLEEYRFTYMNLL